jgi:hypothetical protein
MLYGQTLIKRSFNFDQQTMSTIGGAGLGAAVGGLGGYFGGDDEHKTRNGLMGGLLGAGVGGAGGYLMGAPTPEYKPDLSQDHTDVFNKARDTNIAQNGKAYMPDFTPPPQPPGPPTGERTYDEMTKGMSTTGKVLSAPLMGAAKLIRRTGLIQDPLQSGVHPHVNTISPDAQALANNQSLTPTYNQDRQELFGHVSPSPKPSGTYVAGELYDPAHPTPMQTAARSAAKAMGN